MSKSTEEIADEMMRRTGIMYGLGYAEYERLAGLRKSNLWTFFRKTAAHYKADLTEPHEETKPMKLGSATHCIVWEPSEFEKRYMVAPPPPDDRHGGRWNRVFKEHKAAWAEVVNNAALAGQEILEQEQYDRARFMRDKLHAHPQASALIKAFKPEVSMQWVDPETGLLIKARLDGLEEQALVLGDLKSCTDAHPFAFGREAYKRGYHFQMSLYYDGLALLAKQAGKKHKPAAPVLIAVESAKPFEVACYQLSESDLALGRAQYKEVLSGVKRCTETGRWPGYDTGLLSLMLPEHAGRELLAMEV